MNQTYDPMSLFWLFFIIASLQPIIRQKMIQAARQRMLASIEKKRNSRVIMLVHRQESMSFLGFPLVKYISMEDSEEILRALESTDEDKDIDLVLHTPGGLVLASLQIARAIKNRKGKVRVIVPHYAMSGGTLIALAADEIIMSKNAVLGPVDPQLGEYPAASLSRVIREKDINKVEDKTLILADVGEKALRQIREAVEELLTENYGAEKAKELAATLSQGTWTHDYAINADIARGMGIHVSTEIPVEFLQLMSLYPQPVKKQPSVEYVQSPERHRHKMDA